MKVLGDKNRVISDRGGSVTTQKQGKRPAPYPMSRNSNNWGELEEVDVENLLGQRYQGSTFGAQDFAVNSKEDGKMIPGSDSSDTKNDDSPSIPSTLENVISDRGGGVTTKTPGERPTPDPMSRNSNNSSVLEEVDVDNLLGQRHQGSTFGAQDFAVNSKEDGKMIPGSDSSDSMDDDSLSIISILEVVISDREDDVTTKKPEERPTPDPMSRNSNNSSVLEEVDVDNLLGQRHQGSTFGAQDFAVNSKEDGKMIPGSDSSDSMDDDSLSIISILEVVISDREDDVTTKKPEERPTPDPMSRNSNNSSVLEEVDVDNLLGQRHQGSTFGAQDFAVNSKEDGKMIPGSDSSDSMDDDSLSIISILEVVISDREDDVTTKKPGERPTPDPMSRNSNNSVLEEVDVDNLLGQRHQGSTFGAQDFAVNSNEDGEMIPGSDSSDSMDDGSLSIISILEVVISDREDDVTTKKPGERPTPDPMSRNSNNSSVLEEVDVDNLLGQRHQGSTFGAQDFTVNSNEDGKMIPGKDSSDTSEDYSSFEDEIMSPGSESSDTSEDYSSFEDEIMSPGSDSSDTSEDYRSFEDEIMSPGSESSDTSEDYSSFEDEIMSPGSDSSDTSEDNRSFEDEIMSPGSESGSESSDTSEDYSSFEDEIMSPGSDSSDTSEDYRSFEDEIMSPGSESSDTKNDDSPSIPSTLENVISDRGGGVTTKKPEERPTPDPMSRNSNNSSVLEEVDVDNLLGRRYQGSTFGAQDFAVNSNEDEMMIPGFKSIDTSKKEIIIPRKISSLKRNHAEDVGPSESKVMKKLDMVEEMERKKMEKNKEKIEEWWKVSKKLPKKNKKDKIKQNLHNQKMATAKMQEKRPETELEKKIGKRLTIAKEKLKALKKAKAKMVKQVLKKQKSMKRKLAQQKLEVEKLEREKIFISIKESMVIAN
ncbi:GM13068 [Drosophila sechellia]|uniref:GM13068 n=1 Tax=Drosophila sechellia TaxID=7238 RepID=B4IK23_DROSE|nr:GM13068 [Drosophila sechellia]